MWACSQTHLMKSMVVTELIGDWRPITEVTESSTEDVSQLLPPLLQAHVMETETIHCFCCCWLNNCSRLYPKERPDRGSTCSQYRSNTINQSARCHRWDTHFILKFRCVWHSSNHIPSWKALWYWRSIVVIYTVRVAKDGAFTVNWELVGVPLRRATTSA